MHPTFTKINRVRATVTCNVHTRFEFNRMHHLDTIVFTHIYIDTHIHHRENSINEIWRPQNVYICQNLKVNFFQNYNILSLHCTLSESKNKFVIKYKSYMTMLIKQDVFNQKKLCNLYTIHFWVIILFFNINVLYESITIKK